MQPTITTQYYGIISIVNPNSKDYYLKMMDIIEDCEGQQYEVWQHANGYHAAIPLS